MNMQKILMVLCIQVIDTQFEKYLSDISMCIYNKILVAFLACCFFQNS